jgi:hypothetical protein
VPLDTVKQILVASLVFAVMATATILNVKLVASLSITSSSSSTSSKKISNVPMVICLFFVCGSRSIFCG